MEIDLLPLFSCDGKKLEINTVLTISSRETDDFQIASPVSFSGGLHNLGGTVELFGEVNTRLKYTCDRCTEDFEEDITFSVSESYKKADLTSEDASNTEENPDITYVDFTTLNLEDVIYTNLYINLPTKRLCKEDCKGLCMECGTNLNVSNCDCKKDDTDPRFDILDSLLND